jgi:thiamine-phosphate pyrophosphorylase
VSGPGRGALDEAANPAEAGCQLLLIGPLGHEPALLAEQLDAALAVGDIAGFVLRVEDSQPDLDVMVAQLAPLRTLCANHTTAFIVRDRLELALEMGADGVHLGGGAGNVQAARAALGRERILGVSCGASRDAAMVAGEQGADYVAFGDLGKPPGPEVYDLLRWWSELFVLPCLAEVATTVGDCARLARAGADLVAAGEGVWTDPEGAAAAVRSLREALQAG